MRRTVRTLRYSGHSSGCVVPRIGSSVRWQYVGPACRVPWRVLEGGVIGFFELPAVVVDTVRQHFRW